MARLIIISVAVFTRVSVPLMCVLRRFGKSIAQQREHGGATNRPMFLGGSIRSTIASAGNPNCLGSRFCFRLLILRAFVAVFIAYLSLFFASIRLDAA